NDAKDRDGLVTCVVEANEIFKDTYGHYPDIFSFEDVKILKAEQKKVFKDSTAAIVAEEESFPGFTPGLDNLDKFLSGFGGFLGIGAPHNELGGKYAGDFKKLHHNYYHGHNKDHRYELDEDKKAAILQEKWKGVRDESTEEPQPFSITRKDTLDIES